MAVDKTSSKSIRLTAFDGEQIRVFLLMVTIIYLLLLLFSFKKSICSRTIQLIELHVESIKWIELNGSSVSMWTRLSEIEWFQSDFNENCQSRRQIISE